MSQILFAIQDLDQLPPGMDWLTAAERAKYESFRFEKRRRDWLLGRWTAKQLLLNLEDVPANEIGRLEIATGTNGAPRPLLDSRPAAAALSLSHSNGRAFCAASHDLRRLGCDIELVESRSFSFIDTFFTARERQLVVDSGPADRDALVTMVWSAKESVLKALGTGLSVDTIDVEVKPRFGRLSDGWQVADVVAKGAEPFVCCWRRDGQFVLSVSATISEMSRTCTLSSSSATRTASSIIVMQKEQPTAIVSAPVSRA
jgi:4'-phosphopantetheinyl transferase